MKPDITHTFEEIYTTESDTLFRFCLTRVSDREQALDITQEAFVRLWQTMQKGDEIQNTRAFLFTIIRHLIIDWYRKKKSIVFSKMADEETGEYDVIDASTADNLDLGPEGRYLLEKINELSPTYRDPVYLRYVEGLSPGEIGESLGISANAASVRVNRGLLELRKKTGYSIEEGN